MRISDWSSDVCSSDLRPCKGGHDGVADGLHQGPVVAPHDAAEISEVIAHQVIGGGIADAAVEVGRAPEVGEQQGDARHRHLVARAQHLVREEVAEGLQGGHAVGGEGIARSEEHTSELQSLMRISYAVFCLKKKKKEQ